ADAQRHAVRGSFIFVPPALPRLAEFEGFAQMRLEGGATYLGRVFAVGLGTGRFRERRPVAARGDGLQGAVEQGAVRVEQGMRHGSSCAGPWRGGIFRNTKLHI